MPQLVQQQLPQITQEIARLAGVVYKERIKHLEENEKYIRDGFQSDDDDSDAEEIDDEANPNAEYDRMKKAMGFKGGKPQDGDAVSDDSDDSEYEETAGEYALYDSPLEDTDELITIKETLDQIH